MDSKEEKGSTPKSEVEKIKAKLEFRDELHPYKKNMKKFEEDYKFTYGDGKKTTPRFCTYNNFPHVYLDETIITHLAESKEDKLKLFDYIKKNFKEGWDLLEIVEEDPLPDPPALVRTDTVDDLTPHLDSIKILDDLE